MFFAHHLKMFLQGFFHELLYFFSGIANSNTTGYIRRIRAIRVFAFFDDDQDSYFHTNGPISSVLL